MKIAPMKNNPDAWLCNKFPLLPLMQDEALNELNKSNSMTVESQSQPGVDASPEHEVTVPVLQWGETLQLPLRWRADIVWVLTANLVRTVPLWPLSKPNLQSGDPQFVNDNLWNPPKWHNGTHQVRILWGVAQRTDCFRCASDFCANLTWATTTSLS